MYLRRLSEYFGTPRSDYPLKTTKNHILDISRDIFYCVDMIRVQFDDLKRFAQRKVLPLASLDHISSNKHIFAKTKVLMLCFFQLCLAMTSSLSLRNVSHILVPDL
jgi:hypothetical protein